MQSKSLTTDVCTASHHLQINHAARQRHQRNIHRINYCEQHV